MFLIIAWPSQNLEIIIRTGETRSVNKISHRFHHQSKTFSASLQFRNRFLKPSLIPFIFCCPVDKPKKLSENSSRSSLAFYATTARHAYCSWVYCFPLANVTKSRCMKRSWCGKMQTVHRWNWEGSQTLNFTLPRKRFFFFLHTLLLLFKVTKLWKLLQLLFFIYLFIYLLLRHQATRSHC